MQKKGTPVEPIPSILQPTVVSNKARAFKNEEHAQVAFAKLQVLRERLSENHAGVSKVSLSDLRRSPNLRSLILNYDLNLFKDDPKPLGSFERTYANKKEEEVANVQRVKQSQLAKDIANIKEIREHNQKAVAEFNQPEEGLAPPKEKFDMKLFKKQVKEEIDLIAEQDPEKAKNLQEFIFGNDPELSFYLDGLIPEEEILSYPGSIKGPNPEDDPESWAKWYWEHQPKSAFYDGNPNAADLGVRYKFMKPKGDMATVGYGANNHIYKNIVEHFFETDEFFPVAPQEEEDMRPEFVLLHKENFNV